MLTTRTGLSVDENFLKVIPDANGLLPNISCNTIDMPWRTLVLNLAQICEDSLPNLFHSAYVRGSVANNRARLGSSDVDLIVVAETDPSADQAALISAAVRTLLASSRLTDKAELDFIHLEQTTASTAFRLHIGVYGKFILGKEDLGLKLPKLRIGRDSFHHANNLPAITAQATKCVNTYENARWYARNALRSGMEIIAPKAGYTTRDLYGCYLALQQFSPIPDEELETLLFVGIDPGEAWEAINVSFMQRCTQYLMKMAETV